MSHREKGHETDDEDCSVNNGNFDLFDDDTRVDDRRGNVSITDASDFIVDIREYDVPYHVRVMIDKGSCITCHVKEGLATDT